MTAGGTWTRFSLLRRNPGLTREQFRDHYLNVHGPLAAAQAGFRKHTLRYVQNHVEDGAGGGEAPFDGITATTQVPRADYSRGFFHEPDYAAVKDDESYLFDITRTVSVLGESVGPSGAGAGVKLMVLTGADWRPLGSLAEPAWAVRVSRLEGGGATALGFGDAVFSHPFLVEQWFPGPAERAQAIAGAAMTFGDGAVAMPVREVLMFGPEQPYGESLRPGGTPAR